MNYLRRLSTKPVDLLNAVSSKSPEKVLSQLQVLQAEGQQHVVTAEVLEAAIRCMKPANFFQSSNPVYPEYQKRMSYLRRWIAVSGISLTREICFLLLEEARIVRSGQQAEDVWAEMHKNGIKPNTYCYNSYMAATCMQPSVLKESVLRRRHDSRATISARHDKLEQAQQTSRRSVQLYREMLRAGVQPNAMTIEILLLNLGNSANFSGIRSLLLQTWNLWIPEPAFEALENQETPDEYEEEGIYLDEPADVNIAKQIPAELNPTQKTLLTIALIYGVNQQVQLGMHTVELFAKVYKMNISTEVWTKLMQWATLDSTVRGGFTDKMTAERIFEHVDADKRSVSMYAMLFKDLLLRQTNSDRILALIAELPESDHAQAVVATTLQKLEVQLQKKLSQLQRRLKIARGRGGVDEIRILQDDIAARSSRLAKVQRYWSNRAV